MKEHRFGRSESTTPERTVAHETIACRDRLWISTRVATTIGATAESAPRVGAARRPAATLVPRLLVADLTQRRRGEIDQISVGVDVIENRAGNLGCFTIVARIVVEQNPRFIQSRQIKRLGCYRLLVGRSDRPMNTSRRPSTRGTAHACKQCQHNWNQPHRTASRQSRETSKQRNETKDKAGLPSPAGGGQENSRKRK